MIVVVICYVVLLINQLARVFFIKVYIMYNLNKGYLIPPLAGLDCNLSLQRDFFILNVLYDF